jgi:hypothetical protein
LYTFDYRSTSRLAGVGEEEDNIVAFKPHTSLCDQHKHKSWFFSYSWLTILLSVGTFARLSNITRERGKTKTRHLVLVQTAVISSLILIHYQPSRSNSHTYTDQKNRKLLAGKIFTFFSHSKRIDRPFFFLLVYTLSVRTKKVYILLYCTAKLLR